jgi:hypothetical protein
MREEIRISETDCPAYLAYLAYLARKSFKLGARSAECGVKDADIRSREAEFFNEMRKRRNQD